MGLFAYIAIAAVAYFALASGTGGKYQKKPKTEAPKGSLGSDTGQEWSPVSALTPPGSNLALATVTLLGLEALSIHLNEKGEVVGGGRTLSVGDEILLILQGNQQRKDLLAKPLVAVTGAVTNITADGFVDVKVDAIVNKDSEASKLPPTDMPHTGTLRISYLQIAAFGTK